MPATANGICGTSACVINMKVTWDFQIVDSSGSGETTTVTYKFRDVTGSSGSCSFSIAPDLSVAAP